MAEGVVLRSSEPRRYDLDTKKDYNCESVVKARAAEVRPRRAWGVIIVQAIQVD